MQSGYTSPEPEVIDHKNFSNEQLPRRALSPGRNMGLSVLLNVQEDEYYCSSSESVGFKILMHTPDTLPQMSEFGKEWEI